LAQGDGGGYQARGGRVMRGVVFKVKRGRVTSRRKTLRGKGLQTA
jgi:hypothetical protein